MQSVDKEPVRWDRVVRFYGLACAGSMLCGFGVYASQSVTTKFALASLLMFSPLAAAAITQKSCGEPVRETLGCSWGGLLGGCGLASIAAPAAFVAASLAVSLAMP